MESQQTYLDIRRAALRMVDLSLRASLLIVPERAWQDLATVMLTAELGNIHENRLDEMKDFGTDLINTYGPRADNWVHAGRLADCGWIIWHLVAAVNYYQTEDWMNSGLECQSAVERMSAVSRQSGEQIAALQDTLARTMNSGTFDWVE